MTTTTHGIGLLGCGAIGRSLAMAIEDGTIRGARLVALYDKDRSYAQKLSQRLEAKVPPTDSFQEFIETPGMSMVVEAASQAAVHQHAEAIISRGKQLLIMSTGALLNTDLFSKLASLSQETGCRIFVPSGAIGGIDAIKASRSGLYSVVLTTRKPPASIVDIASTDPDAIKRITAPTVVFEGNATEAVKRFPANINVAATLSLAGIGPEKTLVRIIADPDAKGNIHEIYAKGQSGEMRFVMENVPHPENPMTSYQAVLSAIETLKGACEGGFRIGA